MSLMPTLESVFNWLLDNNLATERIVEIWVYGSVLNSPSDANDVDIVVKFANGFAAEAVLLRRLAEREFQSTFRIPLHAIFLSEAEFSEEEGFLSVLLATARRIR